MEQQSPIHAEVVVADPPSEHLPSSEARWALPGKLTSEHCLVSRSSRVPSPALRHVGVGD